MKAFGSCQSENAKTNPCSLEYRQCTEEISSSDEKIKAVLPDIEIFAFNHWNSTRPIEIQIRQIVESLETFESTGLLAVTEYFHNTSRLIQPKLTCSQAGDFENYIHTRGKVVDWYSKYKANSSLRPLHIL